MTGHVPCTLALAGLALALPGPAARAGPFGEPGYDPILMAAWATDVEEVVRGPVDIMKPGGLLATHGTEADVVGAVTGGPLDVLSLGDGGSITLHLESGIWDGPGDDFAVYENGFFSPSGLFAEFAFVEVSSNGMDFARFDAETVHAEMVPPFGEIDPSDFNNLAGDQPLGLGTGFDLAELWSDPLIGAGLLDLSDVQYVRLVDVVGNGSRLDSLGNPIWDPYATPYPSGGCDVDAVGVLHAPEPGANLLLSAGALALVLLARWRSCLRAG